PQGRAVDRRQSLQLASQAARCSRIASRPGALPRPAPVRDGSPSRGRPDCAVAGLPTEPRRPTAGLLMGHASVTTTEIYLHRDVTELAGSQDRLPPSGTEREPGRGWLAVSALWPVIRVTLISTGCLRRRRKSPTQ